MLQLQVLTFQNANLFPSIFSAVSLLQFDATVISLYRLNLNYRYTDVVLVVILILTLLLMQFGVHFSFLLK